MLPTREEFPYAIRQVSEALGSNGSTSMGSVCASTLALLNAGVPLRAPVAGIAMGLISDTVDGKTEYVTLTDILGAEDAFGDMDFKVAGTSEFVTALQLDTKLDGIPASVLAGALTQAREARFTILDVMAKAISEPAEMSPYAPRIITIKIPVDQIGAVIGPKGKMINQIQDETGAEITIEDDGTIYIGATDGPKAEAARAQINAIANPTMPEVGERYLGTVVKTTTFGAFISLVPGQRRPAAHLGAAQDLRRQAGRERRRRGEGRRQGPGRDQGNRPARQAVARAGRRRRGRGDRGRRCVRERRRVSARQLADQKIGSTRTLISGADGAVVRRTILPGGLRVITEAMPTVRSVSFGVWVGVGSRDETPALAGSSHYLEHVLFKGTKRRDALEISAALDAVGGEMNAFTSKEYTCFYARVLDNDLPLAVDVISDMMTSSLVRTADVDSERGVILEEIAMHEDDPGDVVHDAFAEALFGDTPLGRPILGTVESINALQRSAINGYYRRRYRPENMVVAVAGNIEHAKVVRLVAKAFGPMLSDDGQVDRRPAPPRVGGRPPASRSGVSVVPRPTEQAHLVLGVPAFSRVDERRFALGVLNGALGGGMSSRLFQEIREKRGLAYSVYSYAAHHAETGMFGVYAGCQPAKAEQRCSRSAATSSISSRAVASRPTSSRAGRASSRGRSCSGSKTPVRA